MQLQPDYIRLKDNVIFKSYTYMPKALMGEYEMPDWFKYIAAGGLIHPLEEGSFDSYKGFKVKGKIAEDEFDFVVNAGDTILLNVETHELYVVTPEVLDKEYIGQA